MCKKCKMAEKAHTFIYKRADGEETNICVQVVCFFDGYNAFVCPLPPFCSYVLRVSGRFHNSWAV